MFGPIVTQHALSTAPSHSVLTLRGLPSTAGRAAVDAPGRGVPRAVRIVSWMRVWMHRPSIASPSLLIVGAALSAYAAVHAMVLYPG